MALFDDTIPPNTQPVKLGAERIRELKTQLNTVLAELFEDNGTLSDDTITSAMIQDLAILTAHLAVGILSADTDGRAKMADGYLTLAKIAAGIFTADADGRAKFADGFIDAAKLATDSVINEKILDGTIESVKLADPPVVTDTFVSPNRTIPTSGTPLVEPHGLGATPVLSQVTLICTDAGGDRGYTQNQEVLISTILANASERPAYTVAVDATNVTVQPLDSASNPRLIDTDGDYNTLTLSKWRVKIRAIV